MKNGHTSNGITHSTNGHRHTVVDLFAGAGGISEGFRQAGYSIVAGLDNDPDAMATYALNFPEAVAISGDVRRPAIREQLKEIIRNASVIVGGPPCQAFSQVRNHTRVIDDPRNSLYREFVLAIRLARPSVFLMENVTGMEQMGVRKQIGSDLSLDGEYRVVSQILDAADFGVPQTRRRLVFIGVRSALGIEPPQIVGTGATRVMALGRTVGRRGASYKIEVNQDGSSQNLLKALSDPKDASVVSASDAISDLSGLPAGNREDRISYLDLPPAQSAFQRNMRAAGRSILANVQVPRIQSDTVLRLRAIPKGGNHRDLSGPLLRRYITGHRWGQDNGSGRLSRRHFYAYRRLHPQIWAWTLNTKADSVYHYFRPRSLSVREFARLQSFPDRFIFASDPHRGPLPGRHDGGAAHSRYRQVGNAVPPLLARAIAAELMKVLKRESAPRSQVVMSVR